MPIDQNQLILSRIDNNALKINQLNAAVDAIIAELAKINQVSVDDLLSTIVDSINKSFTVEGKSQLTYYNC